MSASSTDIFKEKNTCTPNFFVQPKESHYFPIKGRELVGVIQLARMPAKIHLETPTVLANSFIHEYQPYLLPNQIKSTCNSWDDVRKFYAVDYFNLEREKLRCEEINFWVEAFVGKKLSDGKLADPEFAGFATFRIELTDKNAVYMELLAVNPKYQRMGIGKELVYSPISLNEIPDLHTINLDLRILNKGGRKFYTGLGFHPNPEYQGAPNAVDRELLEVFTWRKKPSPQNTAQPQSEADIKSGRSSLGM